MSNYGYKEDTCWFCLVAAAVVIAVFAALFFLSAKWTKEEHRLDRVTPVVYTIQRGSVVSVNRCYSSKYSYDCTITMSDGEKWRTDITDWPDEFLTPGNALHWEIWTQGNRQRQLVCTTTKCFGIHRFMKGDDNYSEVFARGN